MRTPSGGTMLFIFKKRRILLYDAQLILNEMRVSEAVAAFVKLFSTNEVYVSAPFVIVVKGWLWGRFLVREISPLPGLFKEADKGFTTRLWNVAADTTHFKVSYPASITVMVSVFCESGIPKLPDEPLVNIEPLLEASVILANNNDSPFVFITFPRR